MGRVSKDQKQAEKEMTKFKKKRVRFYISKRIPLKDFVISNEEIKLSNSIRTITFDADDFDTVSQFRWRDSGHGYGVAYDNKSKKDVLIHRLIMNPLSTMSVDHIDGNPLNNKKSNLRVCTHSDNLKNQNKRKKRTSSIYKGVRPEKKGKWVAGIVFNYKNISLGTYSTEVGAAFAYDLAAKSYFGEFARCNFLSHGGW